MKYIVEESKKYSEIKSNILNEIKIHKLPLVCRTGLNTEHPSDFNYVVFDGNDVLKAKFIDLDDAKEYADFLSKK